MCSQNNNLSRIKKLKISIFVGTGAPRKTGTSDFWDLPPPGYLLRLLAGPLLVDTERLNDIKAS